MDRPCGNESNNASMPFFPLYFSDIPLKTQKLKKPSRDAENDYGEENKMFLKFIFTANKKDKPKHFAQGGLFPPPYYKPTIVYHMKLSDK